MSGPVVLSEKEYEERIVDSAISKYKANSALVSALKANGYEVASPGFKALMLTLAAEENVGKTIRASKVRNRRIYDELVIELRGLLRQFKSAVG